MVPPNGELEWHFIEAEDEQAPPAQFTTDAERRNQSHRSTRWHRLYELMMGVAILYGCALYFVWQQAERPMPVLEREVVALPAPSDKLTLIVDPATNAKILVLRLFQGARMVDHTVHCDCAQCLLAQMRSSDPAERQQGWEAWYRRDASIVGPNVKTTDG